MDGREELIVFEDLLRFAVQDELTLIPHQDPVRVVRFVNFVRNI